MELLALDSAFVPLRYLEYINLQWTRKYYECGEFSVQIPAEQYDPNTAYIYTPDRPETGIAQKIEYTQTIKGKFVQISGFFMEAMLNDKIVYPTYYASGKIETTVRNMISRYKADIPLLLLGDILATGTNITWQETGAELGATAQRVLQSQEMAHRCRYSLTSGKVYYEIYRGADRTQAQSANEPVTFSSSFGNLLSANVVRDGSNFKNHALVAGSGEAAARITQVVDASGGKYQKQLFVDAKSESYDDKKQTLAEYKAALAQNGIEKLQNYQKIFNIEVETQDVGFTYLQDYNLGDKCDVVLDEIGVSCESRIVEIYEVQKQNTHSVRIVLGEKILTNYEKARL